MDLPAEITTELLERYDQYLAGQRRLARTTARTYREDLHTFLRHCAETNTSPGSMNRQVLRAYTAHLATKPIGTGGQRGHSRLTIVRKLTALRTFYDFLVQDGRFDSNPVPPPRAFPVKVEKPLPHFLSQTEAKRLVEAANDKSPAGLRDRALLEILYGSGIRLSEAHALDTNDVDTDEQKALVTGKGNRQRWVIYGQPAAQAIDEYLKKGRPALIGDTAHNALFLNRFGGRLSRRSIQTAVSRHATRAGVRDRTHTHTMRHSFATHLLEGGTDLRIIQELLGHVSVATTQVYTHITKTEARSAYMAHHPLARVSHREEITKPVPAEHSKPRTRRAA